MSPAFRSAIASGAEVCGAWLTIANSLVAEAVTQTGFDYAVVDLQHGAIDYQDAREILQAIELGGAAPIVRVPWNEPGIIGRVLDLGAEGVIVPMVNDGAQAQAAVDACLYPPEGSRSHGPIRASITHGADYWSRANSEIAVLVMIETAEAVANVDEILSVEGVGGCYVGPADLSRSLGLSPGNNDGETSFDDALVEVLSAARNNEVAAGIHGSAELAAKRFDQGFDFVTTTTDLVAMRRAVTEDLRALGR